MLSPQGNLTYSSSSTPFPNGSSPQLSSLQIRDSNSESATYTSTPPLTQLYGLSAPASAPAPTPASAHASANGKQKSREKDNLGRLVIVPDGFGGMRATSYWRTAAVWEKLLQ
ncbi:hypothetical protein HAX54_045436 [Datura stramonium]|uniref:Uncharacterized protein n=1 Tax=Datura stramonium TaxID=4076 RepID=A0ABS8WFV8_DATST|nr:hypothetical protein [Datura stramonium]